MSKPYDASTKYLIEHYLADWLALTPHRPGGPAQVINADLSTVTAQADKVLHVADPSPWIFHLELQSSRDDALPHRLAWYNALLEYRHDCLVQSLVVLLRRQADAPPLTGAVVRQFPGEAPYRTFRYQMVRVWQLPVEALLTGGLGVLPLAPLSDEAARDLPTVIHRVTERIEREAPAPQEAGSLLTATDVLLGLRYDRETIVQLMQQVLTMKDSVTYQAIVEEGEIKALRKTLLNQGRKKFGPPAPAIQTAIEAINDIERLYVLCNQLLDANSWEELLSESNG